MVSSKQRNVWIVGGAIRNALLGTNIVEFDLATTLTPDEMKAYPDTIPTGERYGTITFRTMVIPTKSQHYEQNSVQRWSEARRSSVGRFITRRSLASRFDHELTRCRPSESGVLRPFDGQGDLQHGRIRSVGDARSDCRRCATYHAFLQIHGPRRSRHLVARTSACRCIAGNKTNARAIRSVSVLVRIQTYSLGTTCLRDRSTNGR